MRDDDTTSMPTEVWKAYEELLSTADAVCGILRFIADCPHCNSEVQEPLNLLSRDLGYAYGQVIEAKWDWERTAAEGELG